MKRNCNKIALMILLLNLCTCSRAVKLQVHLLNLIEKVTSGLRIKFALMEFDETYCPKVNLRVFDPIIGFINEEPLHQQNFEGVAAAITLTLPIELRREHIIMFNGCGGSTSWTFEPEFMNREYRWQFDDKGLHLYPYLIRYRNHIGDDYLEITKSPFCDDDVNYRYTVQVNGILKPSKFQKCRTGCILQLSEDFPDFTKFIISIESDTNHEPRMIRRANAYSYRGSTVGLLKGC